MAMGEVTLQDVAKHYSVSEKLMDTTVSDEHTRQVSRFLQWRAVAHYLELDDPEVEAVDFDGKNEEDKRLKLLQVWKRKFAFKATYKRLIEALLESGRADHAGKVCKLLVSLTPHKGLLESEDTQTKPTTNMRHLQKEIQSLRDQNAAKDKELKMTAAQLEQLQIHQKDAQLRQRDAELNRLQREQADSGWSGAGPFPVNPFSQQTAHAPINPFDYVDLSNDDPFQWVTVTPFPSTFPSGGSNPPPQWSVQDPLPTARPPSGLQQPLTLRWRKHKALPSVMYDHHCVIVEGKLYIGGGNTGPFSDDNHTVWQYESGQWSKLKEYKHIFFNMAAVKKQLTLVGGYDTSSLSWFPTSDIAVWDRKGGSHTWTHPYPPMPTRRSSPAVATYNQWLVVAGGRVDYTNDLAAVEVLNTDNHQWLSASSLPVNCSDVTTATIQDTLYLVGGTLNPILVAKLPDIIHSSTSATTKPWRTLPAPPLEGSAAITVHGALLAVGGRHGVQCSTTSTAIHAYQPATKSWSKVGDLPSPRAAFACIVLHSGELLVAGGWDISGLTARVDVAVM